METLITKVQKLTVMALAGMLVVVMLLSEERDKILPILDRWAALIRRTAL